jgi:hypothetical protein
MICQECNSKFSLPQKFIKDKIKRNGIGPQFCSPKCWYEYKREELELSCAECLNPVIRKKSHLRKSKSGNVFCSRSCSASYNNKNKKNGTRRSKMEIWVEDELRKEYDIEIIFNGKEDIGSELDIYIPSLKIAFEMNGIFHYEPIFGNDKFEKIQNNDNRKYQACLDRKIELCIIDTSGSKNFKPERDIKYLNIIRNIIDMKIEQFGI